MVDTVVDGIAQDGSPFEEVTNGIGVTLVFPRPEEKALADSRARVSWMVTQGLKSRVYGRSPTRISKVAM